MPYKILIFSHPLLCLCLCAARIDELADSKEPGTRIHSGRMHSVRSSTIMGGTIFTFKNEINCRGTLAL